MFVLHRLLFRVLCNTLHPTAALKSAWKDKVDLETYHSRMQHWNLRHSRASRLPVCADNPGLEASTASVVS